MARNTSSQLIIASHSEVVMQEATDRDVLVSFVGSPKRVDDRGSQIGKALKEIRAEDYYQAERKGSVLYVEGSTDLSILSGIAKILNHPSQEILSEPFVCYVANQPNKAMLHYHGIREVKQDLRAFALFDRLDRALPDGFNLPFHTWSRREIENYLALPQVLRRYAEHSEFDDLVSRAETERRADAMDEAINEVTSALRTLGRDPWGHDIKVSDEVLGPIFSLFYAKLDLSNRMNKTDYHSLIQFMVAEEIDAEVVAVLDRIAEIG